MRRRLLYVSLFEIGGLAWSTIALALLGFPVWSGVGLALSSSLIATTWNWVYNSGFERLEDRRGIVRTVKVRLAHAAGFQAGMVCFATPVTAWWLGLPILAALGTNIGFTIGFAVYAFAFTWAFDALYPRQAGAMARRPRTTAPVSA